MLLIAVGGQHDTRNPSADTAVGPFELAGMADQAQSDKNLMSWARRHDGVAVTLEAAREDFGVMVPSHLIKEATRPLWRPEPKCPEALIECGSCNGCRPKKASDARLRSILGDP